MGREKGKREEGEERKGDREKKGKEEKEIEKKKVKGKRKREKRAKMEKKKGKREKREGVGNMFSHVHAKMPPRQRQTYQMVMLGSEDDGVIWCVIIYFWGGKLFFVWYGFD